MEPVFLSDFDGHLTTVYITIYFPTGGRQRCVGGWQSRLWDYQLGRLQYGAVLLRITSDRSFIYSGFSHGSVEHSITPFSSQGSAVEHCSLNWCTWCIVADCARLQTGVGILHCTAK